MATSSNEKIILKSGEESYCVKEEIGEIKTASGKCFKVYRAISSGDDSVDFLKKEAFSIVKMASNNDPAAVQELSHQVLFAQQFRHQNLMDVKAIVSTECSYCLILPYSIGSLQSIMTHRFREGFPQEFVVLAMRDTIKGLAAAHRENCVHGQLNSNHVFVLPNLEYESGTSEPIRIKLSFEATSYFLHSKVAEERLGSLCLSSRIMRWARAPELYGTHVQESKAGDIWFLGLMALELVNGTLGFNARDDMVGWVKQVVSERELIYKRGSCSSKEDEASKNDKKQKGKPTVFTEDFIDVVVRCLAQDVESRPSVEELISIDLFKKVDTISVFNKYDIDAAEDLPTSYGGQQLIRRPVQGGEGELNFRLRHPVGRSLGGDAIVYLAENSNEVGKFFFAMLVSCDLEEIRGILENEIARNHRVIATDGTLLTCTQKFVHGNHLYTTVPEVHGSLYSLMFKRYPEGLSEASILVILHNVIRVISTLHEGARDPHGNLSASHVYVDHMGYIKVGYAGSVIDLYIDIDHSINSEYLSINKLHEYAAAPEGYKGQEADVWMIGVIALELVYGGLKVKDRNELMAAIEKISVVNKLTPLFGESQRKTDFSSDFMRLVRGCLNHNPSERPVASELENLPIFNKALFTHQPAKFIW